MWKLYYVLLLIFSSLQPAPALAQLNIDNLANYSELDGTSVNTVLPDKQGYIWMGTLNGLVRFDGNEFKRYYYDPNDSFSLKNIVIWSLFEDHKANIWIGCLDNINIYNPVTKSFKQYQYSHLLGPSENSQTGVSSITEDRAAGYTLVFHLLWEMLLHMLFYIMMKRRIRSKGMIIPITS